MSKSDNCATVTRKNHMGTGKSRGIILLLVIAGLVLAWILTHPAPAGAPTEKATDEKAETEKPKPAVSLAAEDVVLVQAHRLAQTLPLTGTLNALVQSTVKAKVSGEVLEVRVREGDTVHRGDVLVRIDTRAAQALVDSQRAALEKARADMAMAKLNLDNNQRLVDKHFIAQNVVDTARSSYEASAAGVKLAEAQLRQAEIGVTDAVVHAPINGVVAKRMTQPGEKISPDSPLLLVVDLNPMALEAPAPTSEVAGIAVGQQATVKVDGFGERLFAATVERINPVAEAGSRAILVYLAVPNADGALRGGMFAQGSLTLRQTEPVPAIPVTAVQGNVSQAHVLVVQDGKLLEKTLQLGFRSESQGLVEVKQGLSIGDTVLAVASPLLKAGMAVQLKPAEPQPLAAPAVPAGQP